MRWWVSEMLVDREYFRLLRKDSKKYVKVQSPELFEHKNYYREEKMSAVVLF